VPGDNAGAMKPSTLSLIAAVARNRAIGRANDLLWSDPRDQKHFRAKTLGCPVIMGRRTWDSLPERFRPLPGRRNVVVTRNADWQAPGAEVAHSLPQALALVADAPKAFVIGGGELYVQALHLADELALTEIAADLEGDTFFPAWDAAAFEPIERIEHAAQQAGEIPFAFVTYRRKAP
jgi:dihydrofolate reductase